MGHEGHSVTSGYRKMAGAPHAGKSAQPHTYPVWIGNLAESVREADLFESVQRLGDSLVSCRVMMDESGKSK